MKILKKLDFLSRSACFTFNERGETTYKTLIGGIISLISMICSFSLCSYFLYRFFKRKETWVIHSTETNDFINNTLSHKMPILLRLSDTNSYEYKNADYIYNITLRVWHGGSNTSSFSPQTFEDVKIEKCNIEKHFSNEFKDIINKIPNINSYYCPVLRNFNQTLYGIYGSVFPFSYYSFTIRFCENSTKFNLCYPINYLKNLLQESYLDIIILDFSMDSLSQTKIGSINLQKERFMISSTMFKRIWLYLENVKFIIDDGYFFPKYKIHNFHRYDSVRFDVDGRNTFDVNYFGTLTLLNTSQTSIYNKSYSKIQDLFAVMGGIIKVFTMIGSCINYFNALNSYYFKLITDFMIDSIYGKTKTIKSTKTLSRNNLRSQISGILNSRIDILDNQSIKQSKTNQNFIKNRITSTLIPIVLSIKKPKHKKEMLLLIEGINRRLNIITVLKKLETIKIIIESNKKNQSDLSKLNQINNKKKNNNFMDRNEISSSGKSKIISG